MRPRLHLRKLGDLAAQGKTTWDHGPDMMNELRNARFWEKTDINVAVVDAGVLRYDLISAQPRRTLAILLSRYVSDFRALHFRRVPGMLQQREHQWPAAAVFPEGTDLSRFSQAYLNKIALRLNQRPRPARLVVQG